MLGPRGTAQTQVWKQGWGLCRRKDELCRSGGTMAELLIPEPGFHPPILNMAAAVLRALCHSECDLQSSCIGPVV